MTTARNMGELAGFAIPRLGMGTMALAIEGRPDRDTAIRTIHAGLDAGVRYLDTAWSYYLPSQPGTGTAEDLGYGEKMVRDALASWDGPRDEVLIATKTGLSPHHGGAERCRKRAGTPAFAGCGQPVRVDGGFASENDDLRRKGVGRAPRRGGAGPAVLARTGPGSGL